MRTTRILGLTALALAIGCGDKDPVDSGHTGDTNVEEEEPFSPGEGTWDVDSREETGDTCQFPEEGDTADTGGEQTDPFQIKDVDAEAKSFVVVLAMEEGDVDVACTWDDNKDFTCETTEVMSIPLADVGVDATIVGTGAISGSFTDGSTMSAQQVIGVDCTGNDVEGCKGVAQQYLSVTLPCEISAAISASLAE